MLEVKITNGSEIIAKYAVHNHPNALRSVNLILKCIEEARKEINSISTNEEKTSFIGYLATLTTDNPVINIAISCIAEAHCNNAKSLSVQIGDDILKELDMSDFLFEPEVDAKNLLNFAKYLLSKLSENLQETNIDSLVFTPPTNLKS